MAISDLNGVSPASAPAIKAASKQVVQQALSTGDSKIHQTAKPLRSSEPPKLTRPKSVVVQHLKEAGRHLISAFRSMQWFRLPGCKKVAGSSNVIVEQRAAAPFTSVSLRGGPADIVIRRGDTQSIVVKGDDNIVALFTTEVQDGALSIDLPCRCELVPSKPVTFYLTLNKVESIFVDGSGNISADGPLIIDNLDISISGSGNVDLDVAGNSVNLICKGSGKVFINGKVEQQIVVIRGSGQYQAAGLETKRTQISIFGRGKAVVDVSDKLTVDIAGYGDVRYTGDPDKIEQRIAGSGKVQKA